jgi:hypothetical protein
MPLYGTEAGQEYQVPDLPNYAKFVQYNRENRETVVHTILNLTKRAAAAFANAAPKCTRTSE